MALRICTRLFAFSCRPHLPFSRVDAEDATRAELLPGQWVAPKRITISHIGLLRYAISGIVVELVHTKHARIEIRIYEAYVRAQHLQRGRVAPGGLNVR